MPKLRNINPLGYVDVPLIGRQGPAPFLVCHDPDNCHDEHEHTEMTDEEHAKAGVGCLVPGEVFEVTAEQAKVLLAQPDNYELVKPPPKKVAKKAVKKAEHPPATEPVTTDTNAKG